MPRKSTCLAVVIPLLSLLLCPSATAMAQHTLGTGSSLSVEDHTRPFLVSPDATFSCGFLEAGENAFSFSVWYTDAADKTAVWTANPGAPVHSRRSRISFHPDGGLGLIDANGTTVWESKTTGGGLVISLLESGNLVISDPSGNGSSSTVWQSFDWPTDTLVPSQPLTKNMKLVAGYFNLYNDNDNVLRLLYDGPEVSSVYWPSPDYGVFGNGRTNYNGSRIGVLDDTGVFLSSDNLVIEASDLGPGIKRRVTIDQDGNLKIYSLNPSTRGLNPSWAALQQPCSVHGLCGKNAICEYQPSLRCSCVPGYEMVDRQDWRKGCKPMFSFSTTSCIHAAPDQFKFVELQYTDFYGYDLGYNQSVTFENCKKLCLEMCLCVAFSYRLTGEGRCYPKGMLLNGYRSPNFPGSTYLKVPFDFDMSASSIFARSTTTGLACNPNNSIPVALPASQDNKWPYLFGFAGVLGVLDLLFIAIGWWFLSAKQNTSSSLEAGYAMLRGQVQEVHVSGAQGRDGKLQGRARPGRLRHRVPWSARPRQGGGREEADKRGARRRGVPGGDDGDRADQPHQPCQDLGFCSEGKHKMLVYEYVENESLDKHPFDTDRARPLPWNERYRIALGTARGLAYLHHECLEWVIYCDVKPENILLTRAFDAKIADFGLAKLSKRDGSGVQFSHMRGTMGYMAPEWVLNLPINAKADVFSYGIVLMEIVTGRRVSEQRTAGGELLEAGQVAEVLRQVVASGDVVSLMDCRMQGQFNCRQALEMLRISLMCIVEEKKNRPTMDDIAKALTEFDEDEHPAYQS